MRAFFEGWRFPVVAISALAGAVLLMAGLLLVPPSAGAAYEFALGFKTWCFGYDPSDGSFEVAYLWMYLGQPLLLAGLIAIVWRTPLLDGRLTAPGAMARWAASSLTVVALVGIATARALPAEAPADPAVFPGDAIRTSLPAHPFELVDQERRPVSLDALAGRVVVVTAVYASCGDTCPLIVRQIKSALAGLADAEREDVTVVAITLDPEKDTPEMLAMMADAHGVSAPLFRSVTGDPATVNAVLDRYGFTRRRNPTTGAIDHVNLVHVIDRSGLIAFRFSLGPLQEVWLTEAIRALVREAGSALAPARAVAEPVPAAASAAAVPTPAVATRDPWPVPAAGATRPAAPR